MPTAATGAGPADRYRADIQGLRALAVAAVVLFHAGLPSLSGGYVGVDVFYVISGFLITGHLLRAIDGPGRLGLGAFYARRARRLLPAAFLVIAATVLAGLVWLPPLQWRDILTDAAASALYVPNVLFAVHGVDYLTEATPSLFQHYWSLGVEEQFYLLWPLVLIAVSRWGRGRSRAVALGVLVAASFAGGWVLSYTDQPLAFFLLPTRAWELGAGGLVAMVAVSGVRPLRGVAAAVAGWTGLGLIVAAIVLYDPRTLFPGAAAVLPVAGAALVILADAARAPGSPDLVLRWRPVQVVGAISYSVYLVHWPLLVIPQAAVGYDHPLTTSTNVGLAVLSVPVGWVLWRFVEVPGQRWSWLVRARPRRSLLTAAAASAAIVLSVAVAGGFSTAVAGDVGRAVADGGVTEPPRTTGFVPSNLQPSLHDAAADVPALYGEGCHLDFTAADPTGCSFGDPAGPTVVLFGDSHAAQWFPPLAQLAEQRGLRLETHTKSSCPSASVPSQRLGSTYTACLRWRQAVLERLRAEVPAVVVLANYGTPGGADPASTRAWQAGMTATIDALDPRSQVVVMADTPNLGQTPSICLSAHLEDTRACGRSRGDALASPMRAADEAAAGGPSARYVDLTDYLCGAERCDPVIGRYLVYRDAHHLTSSFATALAEPLWNDLRPSLAKAGAPR